MMKISTSLIRIRYAVGVMLALSAVFAVVIGTSTLQPRDATAQVTPPTLAISVASADIEESTGQITFSLAVVGAVTNSTDVSVTVPTNTLDGSTTRLFNIPKSASDQTLTRTVGFNTTTDKSGKRVVSVGLPATLDGFTIVDTTDSPRTRSGDDSR